MLTYADVDLAREIVKGLSRTHLAGVFYDDGVRAELGVLWE